MLAIIKRELKSYFCNITGCLFVAVNLLFSGIYFSFYHILLGDPYVAQTVSGIMFLLLIGVPVLTMKSFAEEKSKKTDQLLFTSPVSVSEIVLGKYLAMVIVFAIPVIVMCLYPVFLGMFGNVPYLESYTAILGYFLFGSLCIAIGMLISALTDNLIIASIGAFAAIMVIYILKGICSLISKDGNVITKILESFDAITKLNGLFQGTFDFSVIIYFLSLIFFVLFLVYQVLQKRRYSNVKINKKNIMVSWISIILIAALVFALNYGMTFIPDNYLHVDITKEGIYEISDTTKELVGKLNEDITIYVLSKENDYDTTVNETLNRYSDLSDHIKVSYIDVNANPEFVTKYDAENAPSGSLIVEGSKRHTVINYDSLYLTELDYQTYSNKATGYDAEGQISSAIAYVESDKMPKAYIITGHNEATLSSTVKSLISKGNIETEEINLMNYEKIPEDAEAVIIISPTKDYNSEDVEKITSYLDKGGKAIMMSSYNDTKLENYDSIIEKYGVTLYDGLVVEKNKDNFYQNPYYLLPNIGYCDATAQLMSQKQLVLMPLARPFTYDEEKNENFEYTKVLYTSDDSFAKKNVSDANNYDKESGDDDGPFSLGVLIEDKANEGKILYFSSETLLAEEIDTMVGNANSEMVVSGLNSMVDTDNIVSVSVPAKMYELSSIVVSQSAGIIASIITIILLPLGFLVFGLVIWLHRRKR